MHSVAQALFDDLPLKDADDVIQVTASTPIPMDEALRLVDGNTYLAEMLIDLLTRGLVAEIWTVPDPDVPNDPGLTIHVVRAPETGECGLSAGPRLTFTDARAAADAIREFLAITI